MFTELSALILRLSIHVLVVAVCTQSDVSVSEAFSLAGWLCFDNMTGLKEGKRQDIMYCTVQEKNRKMSTSEAAEKSLQSVIVLKFNSKFWGRMHLVLISV